MPKSSADNPGATAGPIMSVACGTVSESSRPQMISCSFAFKVDGSLVVTGSSLPESSFSNVAPVRASIAWIEAEKVPPSGEITLTAPGL